MLKRIFLKNRLWNLSDDEKDPNFLNRFQQRLKVVDDILLKEAYGRVLEVGCGQGRFLTKLRSIDRINSVWGVDISKEAVKAAYEKGFNVIRANGEKLPFKSEVFEAVMSANGSPKEMDWNLLLSQVRHVLKPGGVFAFDTYNKYPLKRIVKYKIMRFLKTVNEPCESISGGVENIKALKKSCLKYGFEITSLSTVLSLRFLPCEILLKGTMFSQIDTHLVGILKKK